LHRIAAGEVVQRPSAAIKEMIENSLDAGSSTINIIIKGGGLQMIQIQDNGHGIGLKDLEIVCERFTTSKLALYDDLKSISTFGFRGEALASITHVAHVTILTKTNGSACAYRAKYSDGRLIPLKLGDNAEAKPCAGTVGTTLTVEDLFYNMLTRKQAFKSPNEEYQRILDVATRYSVLYGDSNISFTCKRHGQTVPDLHTLHNSSSYENIKLAYGVATAKELLKFNLNYNWNNNNNNTDNIISTNNIEITNNNLIIEEDKLSLLIDGYITNANYSNKKPIYIFFINNRLVDCQSIKKIVESVYYEILPRHSHPFVFFNIK
jgi:DNA mismatch repair protein MLH1